MQSLDPVARAQLRHAERAACTSKGECYHPLVSLVCNQCCRCNTSSPRGAELARLHSLFLASSNFYLSPNGTIMAPHSRSDELLRETPWKTACSAVRRMPSSEARLRTNHTRLLQAESEGGAASQNIIDALPSVASAVCADVAARGVLCNTSLPCHCTVTPSGGLRICTHRRGQRRWRGLICEPLASGLYMRIGGAASRYLRCATFGLSELASLWRSLREYSSGFNLHRVLGDHVLANAHKNLRLMCILHSLTQVISRPSFPPTTRTMARCSRQNLSPI